jgi:hypothetical protein
MPDEQPVTFEHLKSRTILASYCFGWAHERFQAFNVDITVYEKLQLFECGGRNAKYAVWVRKDMQRMMCKNGWERIVKEDRTQPIL